MNKWVLCILQAVGGRVLCTCDEAGQPSVSRQSAHIAHSSHVCVRVIVNPYATPTCDLWQWFSQRDFNPVWLQQSPDASFIWQEPCTWITAYIQDASVASTNPVCTSTAAHGWKMFHFCHLRNGTLAHRGVFWFPITTSIPTCCACAFFCLTNLDTGCLSGDTVNMPAEPQKNIACIIGPWYQVTIVFIFFDMRNIETLEGVNGDTQQQPRVAEVSWVLLWGCVAAARARARARAPVPTSDPL